MKQALFIAGPTASGKSAFALKVASELNGVIINADSMQVYRDLSILTACPTEAEQASAPHRLYGFLDGAEACSAAVWAALAMQEIEKAWQVGQLPILVGGTGLYFKVLTDGIAKVPDIPDNVRTQVRKECEEVGSETLHRELTRIDPMLARRLAPGDSQRISRAIEVFRATSVPLSEWQKNTTPGPMQSADQAGLVEKCVLVPERAELYRRCDQRFDSMIETGALDEVRALLTRKLSPDLPVMRALGVPSLARFIRNEVPLAEAQEDAKMQTRRFAKRQLTWFRNQFSHWEVANAQYMESVFDKLVAKIIKN